MKSLRLAVCVVLAGWLLASCFAGDGSYPVSGNVHKGIMGNGLWHSEGGPACTFSTTTDIPGLPLAHVDEPARSGPRYVQIDIGDTSFTTSGCAQWVQADGPFDTAHPISIYGVFPGDGDYRVGTDVPAGEYRATTPATCTWQRIAHRFGHRVPAGQGFEDNWIENGTGGAVHILATDYGFSTSGCGAWVGVR